MFFDRFFGRARRRADSAPIGCEGQSQAQHLLITGTGRAGTTLLVRIMTNLGLDTGFQSADIHEVERNPGRAGLEHDVSERTVATLPAIVKTPWATDVLHDALGRGWLKLSQVIIPVRELAAAADSRRAAQDRAEALGLAANMAPGGLWKTDDPAAQEPALAVQFYKAIDALTVHDVPMTLISFPRFVQDQDYFVQKVGPVLASLFGVKEDDLRRAHLDECRPEFIGGGRK